MSAVLVVDESAGFQLQAATQLGAAGFHVLQARTLDEMSAVLDTEHVDVILLAEFLTDVYAHDLIPFLVIERKVRAPVVILTVGPNRRAPPGAAGALSRAMAPAALADELRKFL